MGKFEDLTGKRFGRLIVLDKNEEVSKQKGRTYWNCKCDCGNIKPIMAKHLKANAIQSCGCLQKERTSETNGHDLIGKRFGRLTVIGKVNIHNNNGYINWLCKCDCGNECIVISHNLTTGNTQSCGCLHIETIKINGKEHPNYNHKLTDEDRQDRRLVEGYKEWMYEVKEQANFTCDCCGDNKGGNLVSHHLESYSSNKELRTELSNGVCLCEHCHKEFHHIYGYGNNTKEQYIEFKENKNKGEM